MMRLGLAVAAMVCLIVAPPPANALENGLGKLPGLGWNSDYCTNCSGPIPWSRPGFGAGLRGHGGEAFVKHIADHMHTVKYKTSGGSKSLQELGFKYVNMDASWDSFNRSSSGELVPDPTLWPSGIDHTVSYVHSLGMGFGLYGDRGTLDCAKHPGAKGHEDQDGKWLGAHKIDWYKEDACYATGDQATAIADYGKMRDALNSSGYPVWFALCGWEPWYAPHGKVLANSARIGPDTGTGWTSVMKNLQNALPVQQFTGPTASGGYWNDGSLMLTPGMGCSNAANCMSDDRFQSMYAIWTIMSFNLLLVGDFSKLNEFVMGTWTNDWAIAINQDTLGLGATRVDGVNASTALVTEAADPALQETYTPMKVQECGGEPNDQKWEMGEPLSGFISNPATKLCLNVEGCASKVIYDGCVTAGKTCGPPGAGKFANERWSLTKQGQLKSALSETKCATVEKDDTVALTPCASGATIPANQRWKYDNATQQLTTGDGMCVTASSATPGCNRTPQPCSEPGHTFCPSDPTTGQCQQPPKKTCPPCPPSGPAASEATIILGRKLVARQPGEAEPAMSANAGAKAASNSFAMLFINNKPNATKIVCDKKCMQAVGIPSGKTSDYVVQNVWTRERMSLITGDDPSITMDNVPASGGSIYVRLDPQ